MEKMKAKTDETYCCNDDCDKKCTRYHGRYEFEDNKNYWYQAFCMDYIERTKNEKQN